MSSSSSLDSRSFGFLLLEAHWLSYQTLGHRTLTKLYVCFVFHSHISHNTTSFCGQMIFCLYKNKRRPQMFNEWNVLVKKKLLRGAMLVKIFHIIMFLLHFFNTTLKQHKVVICNNNYLLSQTKSKVESSGCPPKHFYWLSPIVSYRLLRTTSNTMTV